MATNLCRRISYRHIRYIHFFYILKENLVLRTLVKELFGSTTNILGTESGGSEALADFIVKGNETDSTMNQMQNFY
jgi:hypothetical protein